MDPRIGKLLRMLRYKRPHGSRTELEFTARFIATLPGAQADEFGNYHVRIGVHPKTLFSAHIDTMHRDSGYQNFLFDEDLGIISCATKTQGCLGTDNASGMLALMELIEYEVPGHYIFHRGEERGRLGSKWLAKEIPSFFEQFHRAIAFDRKADCSIITKQCGRTCCSLLFYDDLSQAFADASSPDDRLDLADDPTGSYTDTASYMDLIPECTNISIGYNNEHTSSEFQDTDYLVKLLEAIPLIVWDSLPTARDPKYVPPYIPPTNVYPYRARQQQQRGVYSDDYYDYYDSRFDFEPPPRGPSHTPALLAAPITAVTEPTWSDLYNLATDCPDTVADLLQILDLNTLDIMEARANSIHKRKH